MNAYTMSQLVYVFIIPADASPKPGLNNIIQILNVSKKYYLTTPKHTLSVF